MPAELFIGLLILGLLLITIGLVSGMYKLYKHHSDQFAVAEMMPDTYWLFSFLNWKKMKIPFLMLASGMILLATLFLA